MNPKAEQYLNLALGTFHHQDYLGHDPVMFVHEAGKNSKTPANRHFEQEIVGLVSALCAYGKVGIILKNQNQIWSTIRKHFGTPYGVIRKIETPDFQLEFREKLRSFSHRFHKVDDLLLLLRLIHYSYEKYGSIAGHFKSQFKDSQENIETASIKLLQEWKLLVPKLLKKRTQSIPPYFFHLLSSPDDKSACKRWCLFLRWMVRKDPIDLGIWNPEIPELKPHHLVIPLDVHLGRISRELGLTQRKANDWRASIEVTRSLKTIDPEDPIKFDFALTRLGIFSTEQNKTIYELLKT
jgi:uncharacterized protein (TIGR02757 family)